MLSAAADRLCRLGLEFNVVVVEVPVAKMNLTEILPTHLNNKSRGTPISAISSVNPVLAF